MIRPKRNYLGATAGPVAGGFGVQLDGRALTTPAGAELILPTQALASAIAEEWRRQGDVIRPLTMPLMRLAATAADRVPAMREAVIGEIAAYGSTDLLCQRAPAPPELAAAQQAAWQPWLDWLEKLCRIRLAPSARVPAAPQDKTALAALRDKIGRFDDFRLAGLQALAANLGSVVLALAVAEGALGAAEASELSFLEERFQARRWGADAEADKRRQAIAADVADVARFLELAGAPA